MNSKNAGFRWSVCSVLLYLFSTLASAQSVTFEATSLGSNTWKYDYSIINDSARLSFDEVTIYFDSSTYSYINAPSGPAGWDLIIVQPDVGIPANGFYDALQLGGPLSPGQSAIGFSVSFLFRGATPGSQRFDFIDSSDLSLVYTGQTTLAAPPVTPVPEPTTSLLLAGGIAVVSLVGRRRKTSTRRRSQL